MYENLKINWQSDDEFPRIPMRLCRRYTETILFYGGGNMKDVCDVHVR